MPENCDCKPTYQEGGRLASVWPDPSSFRLQTCCEKTNEILQNLLDEQISSNEERQEQLGHIDSDLHTLIDNLDTSQAAISQAISDLQDSNTSENTAIQAAISQAETANSNALSAVNTSIIALNNTTATSGANTVAAIQAAQNAITSAQATNTTAITTLQASNEDGLDDVVTSIQAAQAANTSAITNLQSATVTELQNIFNTLTPVNRNHTTNRASVPYTIAAGAQSFSIASVNKVDYIVNGRTIPADLIYQGFPLAHNDTYPAINCTPGVGDELIITETR